MKPSEGLALGDRYRLASRIAVGGMGEVWVAHDLSLARDVAVKVLREEFAGDTGFLERFRTEARNSAQLSHPNIAQLYDYGEQQGSAFLVMELILGEPLADLLDREPVLPLRRLLPILAQTARALHAAHVAGVVHRDVKPGNILLDRSGRVKITDFGISTAINQIPMTDSGMVMGTAQYLSPEQAIGKAATPASDIYALGIVAYEALVGNRPFTGPTAVDIAVAHVNNPVPPLPLRIDPEVTSLVIRMLSKIPEERPRSAASLARMLDEIAERTASGSLPIVFGKHGHVVDVVDAVTTGGLEVGHLRAETVGPRPTGEPAQLVLGRDEAVAGAPPQTPPAYDPNEETAAITTPTRGTQQVAASAPPPRPAFSRVDPPRIRTPRQGVPQAPRTAAPRFTTPHQGLPMAPGRVLSAQIPRPMAPTASGRTSRSVRRSLHSVKTSLNQPLPGQAELTNGRRRGTVSWPLVVAIVAMLVGLLGAAFADTLWGPSRATSNTQGARSEIVIAVCSGQELAHGIIVPSPGMRGQRRQ